MTNKINLPENSTRRRLIEKLWSIYGNHGKYSTLANHKWIQDLLEDELDYRDIYGPSPKCIKAVDDILKAEIYYKDVIKSGVNIRGRVIKFDNIDLRQVVIVFHTNPLKIIGIYKPISLTNIPYKDMGQMKR